jgi:hypothetical protein
VAERLGEMALADAAGSQSARIDEASTLSGQAPIWGWWLDYRSESITVHCLRDGCQCASHAFRDTRRDGS